MSDPDPTETTRQFERLLASPPSATYLLKLFVCGMTSRSHQAIGNIRAVCEQHLAGRYALEIVDLYQEPAVAEGAQVIAAPTLVKESPAPLRRMLGDLSDTQRLLRTLDLQEAF